MPGTTNDTSNGSAAAQFAGPDGTYDILVTYFDENDGQATYELYLNDILIDNWTANSLGGSPIADSKSRTSRTISGITLTATDTIRIVGQEHQGELGRIDSIQLIAEGGSLAGNNGILEIMPLGDSITRGAEFENGVKSNLATQNGYRDHLSQLLNIGGIGFDFVGSQSNGDGSFNDTEHEGHGGWKIDQIASNVSQWLTSYQPEIILLHIGTNDMRSSTISITEAISRLSNLIDIITSIRPNSHLIVASIGPTNPASFGPTTPANFPQRIADYNSRIPGLVSNKTGEGKKVSFVDIGNALISTQHLEPDGYHPNDEGNQEIASSFYAAIRDVVDSAQSDELLTNNLVIGTSNSDTLIGTTNNELIRGEHGIDTLTGGGGIDTFAYSSIQDGLDYITDFSEDDRLLFSAAGFNGGLSKDIQLSTSASNSGTFVSSNNPISLGSSANFLFDTDTGLLQFDRDGVGAAYTPVDIAQLTGFSALSISQIIIAA
ncbi:MAG: hypothetical protein HC800_22270 [Phormidesmis sp. RL_2_1]|nr:hypothetical protein [Phormidesmis sp. RL_2_1]